MKRLNIWIATLLVMVLLIGCGTPATESPRPTMLPTEIPATQAEMAGPTVGGTLVIAWPNEPSTLDPHKASSNAEEFVLNLIGATLVTQDPTGKIVPYLAESWQVSEDNMTWTFKLRQDVKFISGTPLKAQDFVWTFQRALNAETKSPVAGGALGGEAVGSVKAIDDFTLEIQFVKPFAWFLQSLTYGGYLQPLEQTVVTAEGDNYGRNPVGVGPYMISEWVSGEKIVLTRNPEYTWGPEFTHGGPAYIESIEIRFIPEYSTIAAGLETGEIDYAVIQPIDVERIKNTGNFEVFESVEAGVGPYISINTSKTPLNDLNVRKALNLAINKQALVQVVAQGAATPVGGPCSPTMLGYWSGAEAHGYNFDLEQAKSLMQTAGYSYNGDGMLVKDGAVLTLKLLHGSSESAVKLAEVIQQQYKALGIDLAIETMESGNLTDVMLKGDYELAIRRITYPNAALLAGLFNSNYIGYFNAAFTQDPALDEILNGITDQADPAKIQQSSEEAQQYIIDQAYMVPLYAPINYLALSNRVVDDKFSPTVTLAAGYTQLYLDDAYIQTK